MNNSLGLKNGDQMKGRFKPYFPASN
jgi:hypothetical protein